MKIVSLQEIDERIRSEYPNQPYEIIQYSRVTQPFVIQCKKCGKQVNYSSFKNFLQKNYPEDKKRKFLCSCYNVNNKLSKHENNKEKILSLCAENKNLDFLAFGRREDTKKYSVSILCKICNQVFNKDWNTFLLNQTCPYCQSKKNLNSAGFQANLPKEYTLLSEYKDTDTKVLIRHECGFIWKVSPHNLIKKIHNNYIGCPKCNHKRSHGEIKIHDWLKQHNKIFIEEHNFLWSSNPRFRYDFYLPKENMIIEYMGQQHYKEVEFFHDTLAERQHHDKIKQQEAEAQGIQYLIISYKDFQKIETILDNWFNDYSARK